MSDLRERRIEAADALRLRAEDGHYGSMLDDLRGVTYTDGTWRDVFSALARLIDPLTTIHWEYDGPTDWAVCNACGEPVTNVSDDMPNYCMNCGRRIVGVAPKPERYSEDWVVDDSAGGEDACERS